MSARVHLSILHSGKQNAQWVFPQRGGSLPTTRVQTMVEQTCSLDAPHTQLAITHVLGKVLWIRLSELAA